MSPQGQSESADEFQRAAEGFNRRAEELGYPDIRNYFWYHTVELREGW